MLIPQLDLELSHSSPSTWGAGRLFLAFRILEKLTSVPSQQHEGGFASRVVCLVLDHLYVFISDSTTRAILLPPENCRLGIYILYFLPALLTVVLLVAWTLLLAPGFCCLLEISLTSDSQSRLESMQSNMEPSSETALPTNIL